MTHTVTHTGKRADKNNGEDRTYLPQYTERKGSKIPENRQMERPDTLRNQQVMCSSHTTSSKKHRKLRFSMLFCCENAEKGVGQNVGQAETSASKKRRKLKSVSSLFIPISHRCKQKIKSPGSLVMQEAPGGAVLFCRLGFFFLAYASRSLRFRTKAAAR